MAFIFGAVIGTFLLSTFIGFIFLRKINSPKKYYYSIAITWIVSTIIAGYGLADGGAPQFLTAAINYGVASIILISLYILTDLFKKRKKVVE
jgi:uncharacterized membrane protein YczE